MFENLFKKRSGYVSDKWASYFSIYDTYFFQFKSKRINLLEIGVQNGGSLEVWNNYFKFAKNIIGCDRDLKCKELKFNFKRIKLIVGDVNKQDIRKKILSIAKNGFEIIVDDGSHKSDDVISTFLFFYPHLKPGGVYLIEDLHTSYWKNFGGGLLENRTSIQFLKLIIDIINFESWGMVFNRIKSLKFGYPRMQKNIPVKNFNDIESIHFYNSICVIKKGFAANKIGKRIISGEKYPVYSDLPESGAPFQPEPQKIKKSFF